MQKNLKFSYSDFIIKNIYIKKKNHMDYKIRIVDSRNLVNLQDSYHHSYYNYKVTKIGYEIFIVGLELSGSSI